MNYSELLTQIRDYTEVGSEVLTTSVINVFITNVENKIQRELDLDAFRKFSTSTLVVDNPFISLPDDFDFERGVQIVDGNADRTWLEQKDTTFIDEYNVDRVNNKGTPKYYANWDKDTFIVAPTPNAALTVELWYNRTPERLGDGTGGTTTTTYLSNTASDVLLYGTLSETFSYLKNPTYVQLYDQKYAQSVQGLAQTQMGRKRRDEYADGVLRIPLKSVGPGGR